MSEDQKNLPVLPDGWAWSTVKETLQIIDYRGRTPPYSEAGIPHLRSSNVKRCKIIWTGLRYVTAETYEEYMTRGIPKLGDLLFTTEAPLGEVALVPQEKFSLAQRMMVLRPKCGVFHPSFLMYQIESEKFQSRLSGKGTGTTVTGVSSRNFKPLKLLIPPLEEQHRIVNKIEELFTQLDAGVDLLKKLKVKLKRYRQAVLKAAVEGKLTQDWRAAHQDELEPASVLLERILKERREKWEADQLAKMEAKGKVPKDDKWKLKYKEPPAPDTAELPELPGSWEWVTMDHITIFGPQNGLYLPKTLYGSGTPILRIDDFQDDWSRSLNKLNLVNAQSEDITRYCLFVNDLIINRVNSPSHLGKSLVVEERHISSLFESNMMRLHLSEQSDVFFINAYLRSVSGRSRLIANAKWAVNQASINQGDVKNTSVPLPSLLEQDEIIQTLQQKFSLLDQIETLLTRNLKRSEKLRQSILKKAFEGKLVPQDPNDEPASLLLERIQTEKVQQEAKSKKRKTTTKKKKSRKTTKTKQLESTDASNGEQAS